MKVHAIIVTYADRFNLLKEVINSCLKNKIDKITVVDNNSTTNSKSKLYKLSEKENRLDVIWNEDNLGSAKAYKQALLNIIHEDEEYIIMLDDDNVLQNNALEILKNYWHNKKQSKTVCLLIYRPDREIYKKAIQLKEPDFVLSPKNSFYGFDILDKFRGQEEKDKKIDTSIDSGIISYAPYGGMFFHHSLLKEIGYPNEKFFLYSDDHEWSYRITKKGFTIELITQTEIKDIDTSWAIRKGNIFKTIKESDPFRIYYTIRNRIFFERQNLVENRFRHRVNVLLFILILFTYSRYNVQFKIFLCAIKDGLKGDLTNKAHEYINS
jgi:GT2 family glycosyltransferase